MQLEMTEVFLHLIYFPSLPVKLPAKGFSILPLLLSLPGGGREDKVLLRAAVHCILNCLLCWTALKATFTSCPSPGAPQTASGDLMSSPRSTNAVSL